MVCPSGSMYEMREDVFHFKQFSVAHGRCAMKVGTDSVLLGAWAEVEGAERILDLGCGCGLLGLMACQRNAKAKVTGVEIDAVASRQAEENVAGSRFAGRMEIVTMDVRDMQGEFDHILCNPPFFTERTLPPDGRRAMARNAGRCLSYVDVLHAADRMLTQDGRLSVVLPHERLEMFTHEAASRGMRLTRVCHVSTRSGKPRIRALVEIRRGVCPQGVREGCLTIVDALGRMTPEYSLLTSPFYLSV